MSEPDIPEEFRDAVKHLKYLQEFEETVHHVENIIGVNWLAEAKEQAERIKPSDHPQGG